MRSIIHRNFGEPVDVLEQADMPKPEPKAGEVRIKTIMSPIHNHDVQDSLSVCFKRSESKLLAIILYE